MSEMRPDIDLEALARPSSSSSIQQPRRSTLRWIVPLVLLIGFAAVLASTLTDLLRPQHDVTVVRPVEPHGDQLSTVDRDSVAVQASGWIEPDPFPIHITALSEGVVEELLVQESDVIERGQVVARLVQDDARIAMEGASAALAVHLAELDKAKAVLSIATEALSEALEVTEARDVARAQLGGARAAAQHRSAAVGQGEARVALARDELAVQRELASSGASGLRQVELAQGSLDEGLALLDGLVAQAALASAEVEVAEARLARAERAFELRLTERHAVELAEAQMHHVEADVARSRTALEEAELRLARMEVRSPAAGVVLRRLVVPGMVISPDVMGHEVCSIYDPEELRVRVDVPQPEVEHIFVGQRAEIDCEARRGRPYEGEVIRVVTEANLSKVTLEVHVRLLEPDGLARPEMLAQVRFMGAADAESGGDRPGGVSGAVLVPGELVENGAVWVIGAGGVAERRALELGASHGPLLEVRKGLNLTDKLIDAGRASLVEGARVRIKEDNR